MYAGLHVKYSFLSDFNEAVILTDFLKLLKYEIS